MKNFIAEFKEFISKGNAMTMAIGIIIGGAFTAIVNSLVNDIITPLLGIIIGGVDFSGIILKVGNAQVMVGNFIQAVITFLLISLVLFSIIRAFNRFKRNEEVEEAAAPAEPSEEVKLLAEIRDLLDKEGK